MRPSPKTSSTGEARRRPGPFRMRRAFFIGLLPLAGLVAAACGSSTPTSSSTTSTAHSGTSTTVGQPPDVTTANNPKFGTILVDSKGLTLYTLTNNGKAVSCASSSCTGIWPPALLTIGKDAPIAGPGVTGLGTTPTSVTKQITHDGLPLYTFVGDTAPGATNGAGISSFGGTWNVVKVGASGTATPPATGAPASTTPPATTGGGGY